MDTEPTQGSGTGDAYGASLVIAEGARPVFRLWMDGVTRVAASTMLWGEGGDTLPGQPMYDVIPRFSAPYTPQIINLDLVQGDQFEYVVTLRNPDYSPMDITGKVFQGQVRYGGALAFPITCTVPVGTDGEVHLLTVSEFTNVPVGVYQWDLQENRYGNGGVHTYAGGSFHVRKQVTQHGFFFATTGAGVGTGNDGEGVAS